MKRGVLFRCDSGAIPQIGTGHLIRGLLLASALRDRCFDCCFCGRYSTANIARIKAAGFAVEEAIPEELEQELLRRAVVRREPDVLVLDRLDTDVRDVSAVRDLVPVIVTLDDRGSGAMLADMVINAIVGGEGPYCSYDYLVLPSPEPGAIKPRHVRTHVVVSMGGHDARRVGAEVARSLAERVDTAVTLIASERDSPGDLDGVTVVPEPQNFSDLLRSGDIAVVNGGLTLLEAVANGIPSIAVPQYEHQAQTIDRLVRRGAVVAPDTSVANGLMDRVSEAVSALIADPPLRSKLRARALESIDGSGLSRVVDLLTVVERLDWDSAFFGVEIARIHPVRLSERLLSHALRRCADMGIDCVYYLSDCHHAESVRLAEAAGFHFVDIRLTFHREIPDDAQPQEGIRDATPADLPVLRQIAERAYGHSRYWFDRQFSRADCQRFYGDWIEKSARGEHAERVFVLAGSGEDPVGYLVVDRPSPAVATIVLVGVDDAARGSGVGAALIAHGLWWARERGCSSIEVVTQGRNYEAQRAYQRAGFVTKKTELWYHLWRG